MLQSNALQRGQTHGFSLLKSIIGRLSKPVSMSHGSCQVCIWSQGRLAHRSQTLPVLMLEGSNAIARAYSSF
jgi:hypothetical protein